MSEKQWKMAAVQMATGPNIGANLLEAKRLVMAAANAGADLVVLPENFAFMGKDNKELLNLCEAPDEGPLQTFLSDLAKETKVWLVGGTIPLKATTPNLVRAACLVFDNQGKLQGRYDKIHLFDVNLPCSGERYAESETMEAGQDLLVIDSPFGKIGVAICYDLRFPELFRKLQKMGMEICVLPASFTANTGKAHWKPLIRARAIENLSYLIAAAQGGYHINGRETYGHSMIVDPWGIVLDAASNSGGFVIGDVKQEYLNKIRQTFPVLEHRRIHCSVE